MGLNDPFGRVARRRRDDYRALRERLQKLGIGDPRSLEQFTANVRRAAVRLAILVAAAAAGIGWLAPAAAPVVLTLASLALLWLGVNYLLMRANLARYRVEIGGPDRRDHP